MIDARDRRPGHARLRRRARELSWARVPGELGGLADGGLNICHEALDRDVDGLRTIGAFAERLLAV